MHDYNFFLFYIPASMSSPLKNIWFAVFNATQTIHYKPGFTQEWKQTNKKRPNVALAVSINSPYTHVHACMRRC